MAMVGKVLVIFSSLLGLCLTQNDSNPENVVAPLPAQKLTAGVITPAHLDGPDSRIDATSFMDVLRIGMKQKATAKHSLSSDPLTGTNLANAHLTSINSDAEQQFVFGLWQDSLVQHHASNTSHGVNSNNAMWIGAFNMSSEWCWTDGSAWEYTAWDNTYGSEPDNTGLCVHMWSRVWSISQVGLQPPGNWNDMYCTYYNPYEPVPITYTCEMGLIRRCE
ncbi:uncharacterized protein [Amphiura filiformis]|uniref:uncharacterized protein n=1 Tax=Amphiura filiformis TaxID=82378 RepID=UPI003B225ADD